MLNGICEKITTDKKSNHATYLEIYELIRDRDKELANAFNGHSRSNALIQLLYWRRLELITDAELAEFSEETRSWLNSVLKLE